MKEFDSLLEIINTLLGPTGCPWDRVQTVQTLRHYLLEEVYELIDAIEQNDDTLIQEEAGDALFTLVFLALLAEKEKRFTLRSLLKKISTKLVRRHPHVFGDKTIDSLEELYEQWQGIKEKERQEKQVKKPFETIPKALPALSRAQKILKEMKELPPVKDPIASALLKIVKQASEAGVNAELVLRDALLHIEDEES